MDAKRPLPRDPNTAPEFTGPWDPQTIASAGDSTGAYRSVLPIESGRVPHVPGYQLLGVLGQGGMGVVYQARHTKLHRTVALKMVLGDRAEPKDRIRFLAEAEAVAAVRHPNVVQVYEYGDADGQPFLALEYLSGGSLADHLKFRGRMVPEAAASVVRKLALGMQAVHDHGIVHRDLKPANVLFDETGEPKVADFGLAKSGHQNDLTARDAVMGTPAFMSPEQAAGGTKFVGPASDIYSLGVVLYVCLTGKRPFEDSDAVSLLRKVIDDEPERPRGHVPDLPRDLELICLKCLAKAPHERYSTAQALADDLSNFIGGKPVSVRPAGIVERGVKWARRKPVVAAAYGLTAVSLTLAGLVAGAVWLWQRAEGAKDNEAAARGLAEEQKGLAEANAIRAEQQKTLADSNAKRAADQKGIADANAKRADANAKRADAERVRAERIKYALDLNAAANAWQDGQIIRAEAILKSYIPADASQSDSRSFEWHYLWRQLQTSRPRLNLGPLPSISKFRLSADTDRLTISGGLVNRVWDLAKGLPVISFTRVMPKQEFEETVRRPAASMYPDAFLPIPAEELVKLAAHEFSNDGKRFYYIGGKPTFVAALKLGEGPPSRLWQKPLPGESLPSITISPRGAWIAVQGEALQLLDATTGDVKWSIQLGNNFRHPGRGKYDFTSDDKELFCVNGFSRTVAVFDAATGVKRRQFELGSVMPKGMSACSPDMKRLAIVLNGGEVRVWNFQTGQLERSIHIGGITEIAFNPRPPHYLATAGSDGVIRIWDPIAGPPLAIHRGHRSPIKQLAFQFQPPHQLVSMSEDGSIFVWKPEDMEHAAYGGWADKPTRLGFSSDGKRCFGIAVSPRSFGFDGVPIPESTKIWEWELASPEVGVRDVGKPGFGVVAGCSDDFRRIAVGEAGQPIKVLDAATLKEIGAFEKPSISRVGWGFNAILSPDGKRLAQLAGGSNSPELIVWDVDGRKVLRRIGDATPYGFSGDGSRLVVWSGTLNPHFTVLNLTAGTASPPISIRNYSQFASLSHDGTRLAIAPTPDAFAIWDVDEGKILHRLAGHRVRVEGAGFSPDGRTLASVGSDDTLRFWDTETAQQTMNLPVPENISIFQLPCTIGFSPDGRMLGTIRQSIALFDARPPEAAPMRIPQWIKANGRRTAIPKLDIAAQIDSMPESLADLMAMLKKMEAEKKGKEPDKPVPPLVGKTPDNLVRPVETTLPPKAGPFSPHSGPVRGLDFNKNGTRLITSDQANVRVWDAKTGLELFKIDAPAPIVSTQFGLDDKPLVASERFAAIGLYEAATGKQTGYMVPDKGGGSLHAACDHVGKRVLALHSSGMLTVFDDMNKQLKSHRILEPKSGFNSMATSADGRSICIATGSGTSWNGTVWEVDSGKKFATWKADIVYAVAWGKDGKWIASGESEKVVTRNATTGEIEMTFPTPQKSQPSGIAVNHDGSRIAVVCFNGSVQVWDVKSAKSVFSFKLPSSGIGLGRVAFSPDGKRLAASAPSIVRIFNLPE